jgi:hypothetical protein
MTRLIAFCLFICTGMTFAGQYETPSCYAHIPTSCSFNEMTLQLCNEEGKSEKLVFLGSQRIPMPGGNRFGSADGSRVCVVKGIKGTEPKRYLVTTE